MPLFSESLNKEAERLNSEAGAQGNKTDERCLCHRPGTKEPGHRPDRPGAVASVFVVLLALLWSCVRSGPGVESPDYGFLVYVPLFLMAGLTFWSLGLALRGYDSLREFADPCLAGGMISAFSSGFILTFDVFGMPLGSDRLMPLYFAVVVIFLLVNGLYLVSRKREFWSFPEIVSLLFAMLVVTLLALFFRGKSGLIPPAESAFIAVMSNIIYGGGLSGAVLLGYMRHRALYLNVGLVFFVVYTCGRYAGFFWMSLPRTLFFIAGGAGLLLLVLFVDRQRRRVLGLFKEPRGS